jgi:hypothetical protein
VTGQETSDRKGVRLYPPPPKDFDPFTATKKDLVRHGLPLRPDPQTQPGIAALWERLAGRYRSFDHLEPRPDTTTAAKKPDTASPPGLSPLASCGYTLFSLSAPFTALAVTWTVPDLWFTVDPGYGPIPNQFHTFVGLGYLDLHVEMTVDSAQNVTCQIWAQGVGDINLPVSPGDVMTAALCLDPNPPGTAHYVLANETRSQTMGFKVDTGFPPAEWINAGVTRDNCIDLSNPPLSRFGVVYFDEISAHTTSGSPLLTSGDATTMVDLNGHTLASPARLNDNAFKAVFVAA